MIALVKLRSYSIEGVSVPSAHTEAPSVVGLQLFMNTTLSRAPSRLPTRILLVLVGSLLATAAAGAEAASPPSENSLCDQVRYSLNFPLPGTLQSMEGAVIGSIEIHSLDIFDQVGLSSANFLTRTSRPAGRSSWTSAMGGRS